MLKKLIYLLPFAFLACDSDSDNSTENQSQNNFIVELVPSVTQTNVDEEFTVTVNAEETIKAMWVSLDHFATGGYSIRNFGSSYVLHFNFDTLGEKTIYVRCQNAANQVSERQIAINVNRGNAVKITGVQVVSFNNINGTWDPEYPISNPNHLADVFFGFNKSKLNSSLEEGYWPRLWYKSSVKENQGDLTWNISSAGLYVDPLKTIQIGVIDQDEPPLGQNLLNSIQDTKSFSLSAYTTTKPTTIAYSYPEINLEFILQVEWPN
ncbi:hypothetical protein FLJC2902T_22690 [Flavobacterium limnosediminis JC2902]|uniref:Uncharacterized protein n=1 Tax=Flavobacterium limnosediminis JC2902 TaxID=1341181 RepID=V6SKG1_9FLAO|nr:hypothetical protein [Flavobacterium limnosediminis]ESU27091.1 hypothetical protein FLJC2902T_22690 [Flavobacterium limnosediminis JC2902]